MTEAELKGQKFLEYVANNINKLKKNLKKNITFDGELFDDVFQDSIVKVYNSIVKNNKDVKDYEQYFFMSSRYNYIIKQNQERERTKRKVNMNDYMKNNDVEYTPYVDMDVKKVIDDLRTIIEEEFGEEWTNLYFDYMSLKVHGGMSYQKYSDLTGIPVSKVSDIVSKIKNYTKNNEILRKYNYVGEL